MSSEAVAPRVKPRTPQLSTALATTLARDLYGLHVQSCQELDSFLDRNYHLKVDSSTAAIVEDNDDEHVRHVCAEGYVLKVLNAEDSRHVDDVRTEVAVLQHAHGRGLQIPRLVPTRDGHPFVLCSFSNLGGHQESYAKEEDEEEEEDGGKQRHAVRLVEYLPGVPLASVPLAPHLCYQLGQHAASLDAILQDFDDSNYKVPGDGWLWKMENLPCLRPLLDVIEDVTLRGQISDVIDDFEAKLLKSDFSKTFQRGYIHSDFSQHNVLVSRVGREEEESSAVASSLPSLQPGSDKTSPFPSSSSKTGPAKQDESSFSSSSSFSSHSTSLFSSSSSSSPPSSSEGWYVSGVVDFGDLSYTYLLLEVAIAMSDVILKCPVLEDRESHVFAGHVLSGYTSQMPLSQQEIDLLPLAIRARFCQHLVLGHQTSRQDPNNHYVSAMLAPVRSNFSRFRLFPDDAILRLWRERRHDSGVVQVPRELLVSRGYVLGTGVN